MHACFLCVVYAACGSAVVRLRLCMESQRKCTRSANPIIPFILCFDVLSFSFAVVANRQQCFLRVAILKTRRHDMTTGFLAMRRLPARIRTPAIAPSRFLSTPVDYAQAATTATAAATSRKCASVFARFGIKSIHECSTHAQPACSNHTHTHTHRFRLRLDYKV